jgi:hypothetical protein
MADEPVPDEPDADTIAAFTTLLEKIGPTGLDKARPPQQKPSDSTPPLSLETFLQTQLQKAETTAERAMARIEAMNQVLSPEQRTQVDLILNPPRAEGGENPSPPSKKPPPPPPAPKRKWL